MRRFIIGSLFLLVPMICGATTPVRGYVSRPCGLDIDHNGIRGEVADYALCRGDVTIANPAGGSFDQFYVDCDGGDNGNSGTAASPWRNLTYGLANGTPTGGDTQVICFKGTCDTTDGETWPLTPVAGLTGNYTITKSGSQDRDFQYPTKPAVIMGWDADNDGAYPPHDTNDVAVMDGLTTAAVAINNRAPPGGSGSNASFLEFSHFTAKDFRSEAEGGFIWVGYESNSDIKYMSHVFFHDLVLDGINQGVHTADKVIVFNMKHALLRTFISFENLFIDGYGGYFVRGSGCSDVAVPSCDNGPYRIQNVSTTAHGEDDWYVAGIKLWDFIEGVEVLDSVFDVNVSDWTPCPTNALPPGCSGSNFLAPDACSHDWVIRNNEFIDWKVAIGVQPFPYTGGCTARNVDSVVIDRNIIHNTYAPWSFGDNAIVLLPGQNGVTGEYIQITNNLMWSTTGWETCIWSAAGCSDCAQPGEVVIVNNTCVADNTRHAAIAIGNPEASEVTYKQENYTVKNNTISGLGSGDIAFCMEYIPSNYDGDYNAFDANSGNQYTTAADGSCNGTAQNLAAFRVAVSDEAHSKECDPTFVSATDFHLQSSDTCAKDAGADMSAVTTVDYDNQTRPAGAAWDIGADEYLACRGG